MRCAANMIRVKVSDYDFFDPTSFVNQAVYECVKLALLFFVRRRGFDDH